MVWPISREAVAVCCPVHIEEALGAQLLVKSQRSQASELGVSSIDSRVARVHPGGEATK